MWSALWVKSRSSGFWVTGVKAVALSLAAVSMLGCTKSFMYATGPGGDIETWPDGTLKKMTGRGICTRNCADFQNFMKSIAAVGLATTAGSTAPTPPTNVRYVDASGQLMSVYGTPLVLTRAPGLDAHTAAIAGNPANTTFYAYESPNLGPDNATNPLPLSMSFFVEFSWASSAVSFPLSDLRAATAVILDDVGMRGGTTVPAVFSLPISRVSGSVIGSSVDSGVGCVEIPGTIHELFPVGGFDLDLSSISFLPNSNDSYVAVPNSGVAMLPFGTANGSIDTGQTDDSVLGPFPYGFNFPLAVGGVSIAADVGSNGHVLLVSGTGGASRCCSGASALGPFAAEGASFAALSMDLNPAAGGTVWWNSSASIAYATWEAVPEFGETNAQTCQIQFEPSGNVHLVYDGINVVGDSILVGYSEGGGVPLGPSQDLSAGPVSGRLGQAAVAMTTQSLPTAGETTILDLSNLPPNSVLGGVLLGTGPRTPIDLAAIGMEGGCSLQTLADIPVSAPVTLTPPTGTASIPFPPPPNSVGSTFSFQGVVLAPGQNTLGAVVSNELSVTVGDFSPSPVGISVTLNGSNTFNADPSFGFFRVTHNDPSRSDIESVRFDFTMLGTTFEFDTDQTGMADRLDGGQSGLAACANTYRNNSDLATSLVYAGTSPGGCGGAETGCTFSNQIGATPDYQTLEFEFGSFDSGKTFEFDADTDGGAGISGGVVGPNLFIQVRLRNGTLLTGFPTSLSSEISQIVW